MHEESITLEKFIERLNYLIAETPITETHQFLRQSRLGDGELKPYLFFASERYTRNLIYKTDLFELLAIGWSTQQQAPIHGHEGETCWARVESGRLRFTNYRMKRGSDPLALETTSSEVGGPGHLDGPADIHKVENPFAEPAVSLHIYTHPFNTCDIYDPVSYQIQRAELAYYSQFGKRV